MMQQDQGLLLDEEACNLLEEQQRSEVVFQWLTNLKHLLPITPRVEVRASQRRLVAQLQAVLTGSPAPPTRCLLAHCLPLLYRLGDPGSAHQTVEMCNTLIRSKDDAPSSLPSRLAAVACLGSLYEQLGQVLIHSFKYSLVNLLKAFRNAESQGRYEVMLAVERFLRGAGSAAVPCHREIYKVARVALTDRSMGVRWAAAMCLLELQREAVFLWSTELQNMATLCFRAFEGSTYQVRVGVARLLGTLLAAALQPRQPIAARQPEGRGRTLEEVMDVLTAGFLRGGAGFLRTSGDMLKGTSSVGSDVRMGVAQAGVVMIWSLGGSWLEGSLPRLLGLLAQLCLQPRASHSPADAASTRSCLSYMLRSTLGPLLGEKALAHAATHICLAVHTHTPVADGSPSEGGGQVTGGHMMLECCLLELGQVIRTLASTATPLIADPCTALVDTVVSVLLHQVTSVRLAAAWCLRSVAAAMPSLRCVLLDRCAERLVALKSSPEAVAGYSAAVAALLAGAQHCSLGLPHSKAKLVLGVAEDLLRSANQNSRLSLQRTQAGWLLLSSLCTLGAVVVEHHLSKLLLLVRCVFPPSVRELDMELHRGDCFTWQVTLEGRAGALYVIRNLLLYCKDLLTDDIITRLLTPLASAVALLTKCSSLIRSYGNHLRPAAVLYRLRLYRVLALLPPHTYQESYGVVMKELVGELSSPESTSSELTLLPALCHHDDLMLLGPALHSLGRGSIEEQLHSSSVGGGNLDNDPFSLCDGGEDAPTPLPPAVALTAAAVQLFGVLFPQVITAHRLQILEQFCRSVNQLKGQKHQTVQTHVCAALCSLLQHLGSRGLSLGPEELRAPALGLLLGALENSSPLLRCTASQGLARLVQAAQDPGYTSALSQVCLDRLCSGRDAVARCGHALALGALYRYVGGVHSAQHLTSCLGLLCTLAQDPSSPDLQTWCVHSVCVLLDLSSGVCVSVCEPLVALLMKLLLLSSPPSPPALPHALGRLLHALSSALGPELLSARPAVCALRASCVLACSLLQTSPDPMVRSQLVSCLQNLHLFCPAHIHLDRLVPALWEMLLEGSMLVNVCCSYACVRASVLSCVRQLVQRGPLLVAEHAVGLVKELHRRDHCQLEVTLKEVGLEGALFLLLDQEKEEVIRRDIQETLLHLLVSSVQRGKLLPWIKLCKSILSASADSGVGLGAEEEAERADDWSELGAGSPEGAGPFSVLGWRTRGFAMRCLSRLVQLCQPAGPAHFNMELALEQRLNQPGDLLVLHLGELVQVSFMGAMDPCGGVRVEGLQALLLLINTFCCSEEPELPGHRLLEQYQANVGAALSPAFSADAPPDVTAIACQVCSAWLSSGVVGDLRDLRRVHQLLASSLAKLEGGRDRPSPLYNEATVTMETLVVLQAWAEVYVVAVQRSREGDDRLANEDTGSAGAGLLKLVQSDLLTLSRLWLAALQDYAHLTRPQDVTSQLPAAGGVFFTAETKHQARSHYTSCWAPILHAYSLWMQSTGFGSDEEPASLSRPATPTSMGQSDSVGGAKSPEEISSDRLNLILGISVSFLCEDQTENITSCLRALGALLSDPWPRGQVGGDQVLSVELVCVLHRVMVTRDGAELQLAVLRLVQQIVGAAHDHVREKRYSAEVDDGACEKENVPEVGEGGDGGLLVPGGSLVFSALQLCLRTVLRKIPHLSPALTGTTPPGGPVVLSEGDCLLVTSALDILSHLPSICSPEGSVSVLPTLLYLMLGVLRELLMQPDTHTAPQQRALQSLQLMLCSPVGRQEKSTRGWSLLLGAGLNTVLETWGGVDQAGVGPVGVLRVLTVFLVSAGPQVVLVQPLLGSCLQRYSLALQSKDPLVVCVCFQMLTDVFQVQTAVTVPYIRTLGPLLLRYLQGVERSRPQTPEELQSVLEALKAMEALVSASDPHNRPQLMAIFLPILISFLLDENALSSAPPASRALHESALKDLMRLGPQFPAVFRSLMSSCPQLKARLQAAVQGNQESLTAKASAAANRASRTSPSITLKTNFL